MIGSIIKWVMGDLFRAPFVAVTVLLLVHSCVLEPRLRGEIADAEKAQSDAEDALDAEKAAHAQTSVNHKLAVAEAERLDRANVKRVKAEAATESKEIVDDLEIRLTDARRRAADADRRLRGQANAAATRTGSGTAPRMPAVPAATGATGQAAGDSGLSTAPVSGPTDGAMSINERLIATEQALQLDALIQWVNAMTAIDVNGPPDEGEVRHGHE